MLFFLQIGENDLDKNDADSTKIAVYILAFATYLLELILLNRWLLASCFRDLDPDEMIIGLPL